MWTLDLNLEAFDMKFDAKGSNSSHTKYGQYYDVYQFIPNPIVVFEYE